MNMSAKELQVITPKEFDQIEKEEGNKYELIDGIIMMSPTPNFIHQRIGMELSYLLKTTLKGTDCQPLYEYEIRHTNTILIPDCMVFCDGNEEMPEIVFEILSPSTRYRDLNVKLFKYEEMGIKEYWIIDPKVKTITVHNYADQNAETYTLGDVIQSKVRPEIIINVNDIFA